MGAPTGKTTAERNELMLKRALIRLLWNSLADQADCTCCPGDRCPECQAMIALGLGRWRDHESASVRIAKLSLELGGRMI